jgi:DNA-binding CsgD family transcriptional regulator
MEARPPQSLPEVTERQLEVARLVSEGYGNPQIAEELGVSLAGAKYHVSQLLMRLGLERREEIASWYRDQHHPRGRSRALRALKFGAAMTTIGAAGAVAVAVLVVMLVANARNGEPEQASLAPAASESAQPVESPTSTPPISASREAGDGVAFAAEILDGLQYDSLLPGDEIPVLVYPDAPDAAESCMDDLLVFMIPATAPAETDGKTVTCTVDARAAYRLEFGQLHGDGIYRLQYVTNWVLFAAHQDRGARSCVELFDQGNLWPVTSEPEDAPLEGACADVPQVRGHQHEELMEATVALPERALDVAGVGEHCWALVRFFGPTLEESTPVHVRCTLN